MSDVITRRSALSALACAGAMAATIPPVAAGEGHPDQHLLDLGRQYAAALQVEDTAYEVWQAACDAYDRARPTPPEAMRHRLLDHHDFQFPMSPSTSRISDDRNASFYTEDEVERLRDGPRTKRVAHFIELATGVLTEASKGASFSEDTHAKFLRTVPDPEAQARANEIIAAWDAHSAACEAVAVSVGCDDREAAYRAAVDARQAIGDAIAAGRASTVEGLLVRARIVSDIYGDDPLLEGQTIDEKMAWAIVRDLIAMGMA